MPKGFLCLTVSPKERIVIGGIVVVHAEKRGGQIRIFIKAPKEVEIDRIPQEETDDHILNLHSKKRKTKS